MAKRDQIIAVRTTAGEKAEITKRAGGRGKVGAYLRNLGLGRRPEPVPARKPLPDPNVEAEVEEAQMTDDAAREAFLRRRTTQLVGQGRTTPVARREAEAEWRMR